MSSDYLSSLHSHLIEHLNAEVVLCTITDVSIALEWLKSTFLYTRIKKNPRHYSKDYHTLMILYCVICTLYPLSLLILLDIPENLPAEILEEKLQG